LHATSSYSPAFYGILTALRDIYKKKAKKGQAARPASKTIFKNSVLGSLKSSRCICVVLFAVRRFCRDDENKADGFFEAA